jgi:hypothetical protein
VPSTVDLVPGETVIVHLVNGGTEAHEAVLGSPATQTAWEAAHAAVAGGPPGPTPVVSLHPAVAGFRLFARSGERADGRWTVPADGPSGTAPFVVGCHLPGHFDEGMSVPVRWISPDGVGVERAGGGSGPPRAPASG